MGLTLQEAIDNMRGGCAHNFDGSDRKPGNYTNLHANIERWNKKYGVNPPTDILNHWCWYNT